MNRDGEKQMGKGKEGKQTVGMHSGEASVRRTVASATSCPGWATLAALKLQSLQRKAARKCPLAGARGAQSRTQLTTGLDS